MKTSLVVIEEIDKNNDVEWGLSFGGNNPLSEDYFKMPDKETAFRLKERLSIKFPPIITIGKPTDGKLAISTLKK